MGRVTAKPIIQHCIKSHFFDEVMQLPEKVKVVSIQFEVGFAIKRMSQPIASELADAGVKAIRKSDPSVEIEGLLTGTRASMKKDIKLICSSFDLNPKTVRVKRMTVEVGGNSAVFHRMTKMIPGDDEKITRKTVLGLVKWDGSELAIARECHTNPYKCQYTTQTVRTVICEEG